MFATLTDAMLVPLLALVLSAEPSKSVFIDAGTLTSSISQLVTEELGDEAIATAHDQADLWVGVRATSSELTVEMTSRERVPVVARSVRLDGGLKPAIRVAALLITEALATAPVASSPAVSPALSPSEPLVPTGTSPLRADPIFAPRRALSISAGGLGEWWSAPGQALAGLFVGGELELDSMALGLKLGLAGIGCCRLDTSVLQASTKELSILGELSWPRAEVLGFDLSGVTGLGVRWRWVTAIPQKVDGTGGVYFDPGIEETRHGTEPILRAGIRISRPLGAVALRIALGAEARVNPLKIAFHPDYGVAELNPGAFGPWFEVGVGVPIF